MIKLENWAIVTGIVSPYQSPEQGVAILRGEVTGHDKFPDGEMIFTSELLMLDSNNKTGITRNTTYELGCPDVKWLVWLDKNNHKLEEYNFDKRG